MSDRVACSRGWCVTLRTPRVACAPGWRPRIGRVWRCVTLIACLLQAGIAQACGWWGDAEERAVDNTQLVDANGQPKERGDPMQSPARMVELGNAFRTGTRAPRDLALALHWYRLAAERGHPGGQYNLALMHELGIGVVRDEARAADWYLLAARQDDVHAQHHLGRMLLDGRGVAQNQAEGLAWLERAARQGHDEVYLMVASAYALGLGTPADPGIAYAWCWLAELRGNAAATPRCAELASDLDEPHLVRARELATGLVGSRPDRNAKR